MKTLTAMFFGAGMLLISAAHAQAFEPLDRIESILRERAARPTGMISARFSLHDGEKRITFGTVPGSTQKIFTIEYTIVIHSDDAVPLERMNASLRIPQNPIEIPCMYVDLDADGQLDFVAENLDEQRLIQAIRSEEYLHQAEFIGTIDEILASLTDGLSS